MATRTATAKSRTATAKSRAAAKKTATPAPQAAKPKKVNRPAAPVAKPAAPAPAAAKEPKVKAKLVRDSFTMPQADFALIGALKERAIGFKRPAKKSELLRAGLQALAGLNDTALKAALDALVPLKTGRPKKGD